MPFIDCKISKKLTEEEKESIKSELGRIIGILNKPESYLMVGIDDGYTLYFGGKKLENGAYVSVSLFGTASAEACGRTTKAVCDMLNKISGVAAENVYVTYHPVKDWGWNGSDF